VLSEVANFQGVRLISADLYGSQYEKNRGRVKLTAKVAYGKVVRLLLEIGADPNTVYGNVLTLASRGGHLGSVKMSRYLIVVPRLMR
jgi:hypothetical protein